VVSSNEARPQPSSISGWWPSASAISAARATNPNASRKSGNENSRRRERFPSRSQSGTSEDSSAASTSGSGGVPGAQASQCALASSVTATRFAHLGPDSCGSTPGR
jgi:hypothetical protein